MSEVRVSEENIGISITNNCWRCLQMEDICPECQDDYDNKQIVRAYAIVDDGLLSQPRPVSWLVDLPSGHDFVSPITRRADGSIRHEFCEPTVSMEDRVFNPDLEIHNDERVCEVCHYVSFASVPCPNCN